MKNKTITGLALGGVIIALVWLNQPLDLPYFKQVEQVDQAESKDRQLNSSPKELPDVNAAAFKGQGNLAFIWKGLLYQLDGSTGEVKQLSDTGKAIDLSGPMMVNGWPLFK